LIQFKQSGLDKFFYSVSPRLCERFEDITTVDLFCMEAGMEHDSNIDLNFDLSTIRDHKDYQEIWKRIGRIEIKMVEKHEECRHKPGDTFVYENPYLKPAGVCGALLHVLDLYVWRAALGFPSWNSEDRKVFKIHCPDPKGTVWEMRKINNQ
jgi:uncharacterized repeat protein (TIGR04076 family)